MIARRGVILLLVLVALAVIGAAGIALVALSASLDEDADAALADAQARGAADAGIWGAWRAWDGAAHALDPVDRVITRADTFDGAIAITRVARIAPRLWWIAAGARGVRPVGTRPVEHGGALALWLAVDPVDPGAAVLAAGPVTLADRATASGADRSPDGWPCIAAMLAPGPGVLIADSSAMVGAPGRVIGSPPVDERRTLAADGPLAELLRGRPAMVAAADIVLAAGTTLSAAPRDSAGTCVGGATNWGEPVRRTDGGGPCAPRFVVVHARGDLFLTGGRGQGILVVDGSVHLAGDAMFAGIVIARNGATVDAAAVIRGVLAVGDAATIAAVRLAGEANIQRSRCTIMAALVGSSLLQPVAPGGWFGLW